MRRRLPGLTASPTAIRPAKLVALDVRRKAHEERYRRLPREGS